MHLNLSLIQEGQPVAQMGSGVRVLVTIRTRLPLPRLRSSYMWFLLFRMFFPSSLVAYLSNTNEFLRQFPTLQGTSITSFIKGVCRRHLPDHTGLPPLRAEGGLNPSPPLAQSLMHCRKLEQSAEWMGRLGEPGSHFPGKLKRV